MRLDLTKAELEELDLLLRKEIVGRRAFLDKMYEKYQEAKVMEPHRVSIWEDRIRLEEEGKAILDIIQRKITDLLPIREHVT